MKRIALNFLLLAALLGTALGAGEGLCRLFLDPSDYLTVTLEEDDILGYRMKSASRGYDSWGYRNDSVEGGYGIVAIGDSQTFGRERIYLGNYDGHPNRNGYRVIAEAVKRRLGMQRPSSP